MVWKDNQRYSEESPGAEPFLAITWVSYKAARLPTEELLLLSALSKSGLMVPVKQKGNRILTKRLVENSKVLEWLLRKIEKEADEGQIKE